MGFYEKDLEKDLNDWLILIWRGNRLDSIPRALISYLKRV